GAARRAGCPADGSPDRSRHRRLTLISGPGRDPVNGSPGRPERTTFVVSGMALDPDEGPFVELGDRRRPGVRARRADAGDDLVDDVLDARTHRIEVHPGARDPLFEKLLARPIELGLGAISILDGAVRRHPETLLVEPAVGIAQGVG